MNNYFFPMSKKNIMGIKNNYQLIKLAINFKNELSIIYFKKSKTFRIDLPNGASYGNFDNY